MKSSGLSIVFTSKLIEIVHHPPDVRTGRRQNNCKESNHVPQNSESDVRSSVHARVRGRRRESRPARHQPRVHGRPERFRVQRPHLHHLQPAGKMRMGGCLTFSESVLGYC